MSFLDKTLRRRKTLLTKPHIEYIENRLSQDPELLNTAARSPPAIEYDDETDKFVASKTQQESPPLKKSTTDDFALAASSQSKFQTTLISLKNSWRSSKKPQHSRTDIIPVVSDAQWVDVFGLINTELENYETASSLSKTDKVGRKIGENAAVINAWLKFFPESIYTSTLLAGFRTVIDVAEKLEDVRQKGLSLLMEIPDIIGEANELLDIFNDPTDLEYTRVLHRKASELYAEVLNAITIIIAWMQKNSKKKYFKALLTGPEYAKDIDEALDSVKDLVSSVRAAAETCQMRTTKEIRRDMKIAQGVLTSVEETVFETKSDIKHIRDRAGSVVNGLKSLRSSLGATNGELAVLKQEMGSLRAEIKRNDEENERRREEDQKRTAELLKESYINVLNNFSGLLEASPASKLMPNTRPIPRRRTYSQETIYKALGHDRSAPVYSKDLELCLMRGRTASGDQKDQAAWVIDRIKESKWITDSSSAILFVNGNGDDDKISTMSYAAAFLIEGLKRAGNIPFCYFFCGMHISTVDSVENGPVGMMRSLIAQLIGWEGANIQAVLTKAEKKPEQLTKMRVLCSLLRRALSEYPPHFPFYIILDGVSYYETERYNRLRDLVIVLKKLLQIMGIMGDPKKKVGATIKVLMTAPNQSVVVARSLPKPEEQVLEAGERANIHRVSLDRIKTNVLPGAITVESKEIPPRAN